MSAAAAEGGLPEFRRRLRAGVYGSVAKARPADHRVRDEHALLDWPGTKFGALRHIHDDPWQLGDEPLPTITGLAAAMSARPDLLAAVVCAPDEVLDRLLRTCGGDGSGPVDTWIAMCWTSEAAWLVITGGVPGGAGSEPDAVAVLRPMAARLRFLVLSEPMRWRARRSGTWWGWVPDEQLGGSGVFDHALGPKSWERLVDRCREARAEWKDCLDAYQSHRLLRHARPAELEQELRSVVYRAGRSRPLVLSGRPLAERAPLTSEDTEVIADYVDRHLLPRFDIPAVARLTFYGDAAVVRWAALASGAAVVLAGLAAAGCAAGLLVHPAVYLVALCYGLVCAGIWVFPAGWGAIWLLRMPAASVVGVIALVTFLPAGWLDKPPEGWNGAGGWHAAGVLAVASFGYLLIEVRNHGVARWAAVVRALLVGFIGAVHALMVSLIGLVVIAPAFAPRGWYLRQLWSHPGYGHAGTVLALATAWCLAFGVFSQILWDDRPITAPLAHLNWRGGR